jgi:hypothetical protein
MSVTDREAIDAAHRRQEFEQEAGEAVGPMPRQDPEPQPPVEELRVDGTAQLGIFDPGGKKPTSATLTLGGGAFEVMDGKAYRKGDVVTFSGTAVVREVKDRDKVDRKTGIVVSCKQAHWAEITDLTVKGA